MKNGDIKIDLASLQSNFGSILKHVRRYQVIIFFLVVAALYGYIVWRINVYSNAPANQNEANATVAAQPHIDPNVVKKMQDLQSNSVSVQTLFNQARQNPFQE